MKKLSLFLILAIVFSPVVYFSQLTTITAAELYDANDILLVQSPSPNSRVRGTIPVSFRAYDDEQATLQYQVSIFDSATCETTNYGDINQTNTINSHQNQTFTFDWNTRTTKATTSLADGNYCFKLCTTFLNGAEPYAVCNSRIITLINDNVKPVITSNPSKLVYLEGETFNYQVVATDADNDPLTYRLASTADFLTINPQTGLITSSPLSTLGNAGLTYEITVAVSDGLSGETTQTFVIKVLQPQQTVPPTQQPPVQQPPQDQPPVDNNGGKVEEEPPIEEEPKLEIEIPKEGTVFADKLNLVRWKLPEGIVTNILLEYSSDLEEWNAISDPFTNSRTYFLWDVSEIEDGKYYIRISIEMQNGQKLQAVSKQFEINTNPDDDETEVNNAPIIINESPENDSVDVDPETLISAEFIASLDNTIETDSFTIELNGEDIKDICTVTEDGFECDPAEPLEPGRHMVSASVQDSSEQTASREWTFTVEGEIGEDTQTADDDIVVLLGREIPRSGLVLIAIILCIGAALLFIPWILYSIWSKGDSRDEGDNVTNITNNPPEDELPGLTGFDQPVSDQYLTPYNPNSVYDINSGTTEYNFNPPASTDTIVTPQPVEPLSVEPQPQPLVPSDGLSANQAGYTPLPSAEDTNNSTNGDTATDGFVEPGKTS